jgi:hypothetical protein
MNEYASVVTEPAPARVKPNVTALVPAGTAGDCQATSVYPADDTARVRRVLDELRAACDVVVLDAALVLSMADPVALVAAPDTGAGTDSGARRKAQVLSDSR